MDDLWDRRRFLKRLGIIGAGTAGASAVGILAHEDGRGPSLPTQSPALIRDFRKGIDANPGLVAIGHGEAGAATLAAVEALGGMGAFVKPGETVAIKPNVAWDRTPPQAANTHPAVVAALVSMCLKVGAKSVVVTDNTCNEAKRCFTRSGIWKATEDAGGKVVLPDEHRFELIDLGGVLGRCPVLMPAAAADRLINVAVAKHHNLAKFTGAMKNMYGMIGGRRNLHHQRIDDSIVGLTAAFPATLSVVDASRVLFRNGPQGGDLGDTRQVGQVIASMDPVAADAYACTLIDLSPSDLPYLEMAARRGIGIADPGGVERREVR